MRLPVPGHRDLLAVLEKGADQAALSTLAHSEVLLPAATDAEGPAPKALTLPVFEQEDGTVVLKLPPLRERGEDLMIVARALLAAP